MKIALAQIDPTVGALEANRAKILDFYGRAARQGAELVVFPELCLTGYPPKDLLELPDFIRRNLAALESLAAAMTGPGAIVGYVQPNESAIGKPLYNAAALIDGGRVVSRHFKRLLPTYDVFDEDRYFEPAPAVRAAEFRGRRLGLTICEDFWNNAIDFPRRLYRADPVEELARQGASLMINISASPYSVGKRRIKAQMYEAAARRWGVPLIEVNTVGGNDNLIFDGWSNVWSPKGGVTLQAAEFAEDLVLWNEEADGVAGGGVPPEDADTEETIYSALTLGIRDYVAKCGFKRVLIGLSGGIDSALTAALAADALGPENVVGISMPSQYSSGHSRDDARDLARNLGIEFHTIAIEPMTQAFLQQLDPLFAGTPFGLAEENLQARARGNLLMAISNKFGWLVLSTGNKSEMAVGYCTLYGDMSGGLAVLADVLKTQVYALSRYVNEDGVRIPLSTIEKPPSAELRPDQFDTDSLPPYDVLDPIIAAYVEEQASPEQIVARGFDEALVKRILRMIDGAEYKRAQAPLALKITAKAFGSGRRMPIARGR